MRVLGIVLFLMHAVIAAPLFAQSAGSTGAGGGTSGGSASVQIENQSAQGGFIGAGAPTAFVGVDEIYNTSTSARRTTSSNARSSLTARPRSASTTAQRRPGTTAGTAAMGNRNNQVIRSVSSLDVDFVVPQPQNSRISLPKIEEQLARIPGMQESQVTLLVSPTETTAILTGTVDSERRRRVAQQLLLLEPGIDRVQNLLEIR